MQGEGVERLLVKGKKADQVEEIDGDPFRYFLLAGISLLSMIIFISYIILCTGTSHPYPDDTFYSVGRVPRKLLMKYLGIKMYLVRLRKPPTTAAGPDWRNCADSANLALACAGIVSPKIGRRQ